jgi:hypothetical protein
MCQCRFKCSKYTVGLWRTWIWTYILGGDKDLWQFEKNYIWTMWPRNRKKIELLCHGCIINKYIYVCVIIIKYVQIYCKKLKNLSKLSNTNRSFRVSFRVEQNINKCSNIVLNHNCTKLTVVLIVYYYNNFIATSCCHAVNPSVERIHLKHWYWSSPGGQSVLLVNSIWQ